MKPAHMFAGIAAVGMLLLAAAPVRAESPVEFQRPSAADRPAEVAMNASRYLAQAGGGEPLSYSLRSTIASPIALPDGIGKATGVGLAVHADDRWSLGVGSWNARDARRFGSDRIGLLNAHSIPVVILGQRLVLSRFTVTRDRISVALSTKF